MAMSVITLIVHGRELTYDSPAVLSSERGPHEAVHLLGERHFPAHRQLQRSRELGRQREELQLAGGAEGVVQLLCQRGRC